MSLREINIVYYFFLDRKIKIWTNLTNSEFLITHGAYPSKLTQIKGVDMKNMHLIICI